MLDRYSQKILIALICIASLLRLISLAWGAPFFFHPDERNIASAIAGLTYPNQLNPHFFAYGTLPIYFAFFIGLLKNLIQAITSVVPIAQVSFDDAIIILRIFSAILSIATVYLIFKIGELLKDKKAGLIAAFLSTLSIGMIQYAHFGTFETWLTFFSALLFYGLLQHHHRPARSTIFLIGISLGVLISVKISSVIYLPIIGILFFRKHYPFYKKALSMTAILLLVILCYVITNPFAYLDSHSFLNSISYESNVALGKLVVFYTGEFLSASPITFPIAHIYPFLLGPVLFMLFPFSLFIILRSLKNNFQTPLAYLLGFLTITFFSQTFLFAQWTRYFIPTLPFIYLCLAFAVSVISDSKIISRKNFLVASGLLGLLCILSTFSLIKTVYLDTDTRIQALTFAHKTIPSTSQILSEVYDLGITPFNQRYPHITLFNFYDLDTNSPESTVEKYRELVKNSDYLVLPSQRLYKTRLDDPKNFPKGNMIYKEISESSAYVKIYETPCDIWCSLLYTGNPVFRLEQTANIFDRPTVMMYKINHETKH